jgi:2-phospho-L-lactate transferase/gluconeogenesis factor (CofD/UPF0052 family)
LTRRDASGILLIRRYFVQQTASEASPIFKYIDDAKTIVLGLSICLISIGAIVAIAKVLTGIILALVGGMFCLNDFLQSQL